MTSFLTPFVVVLLLLSDVPIWEILDNDEEAGLSEDESEILFVFDDDMVRFRRGFGGCC